MLSLGNQLISSISVCVEEVFRRRFEFVTIASEKPGECRLAEAVRVLVNNAKTIRGIQSEHASAS